LNSRSHIAVIGLALIDRVYHVNTIPQKAGKHFASGYYESVGGIAANAALAASKLGATVSLISRIGNDANGQWLLNQLSALNTNHIESIDHLDTASSIVIVEDSGERLIVNYTNTELVDSSIKPTFTLDNGVQAVMSDLRWHEGALKGLKWAKQNSVPGLLDYDQSPNKESSELLDYASHVVFGKQALLEATQCTSPREGIEKMSSQYTDTHLAVTLGEDGVLWKSGQQPISKMAVRRVTAIDTLGAGDVFHGACTLALASNQSFGDALRFASDVASLKVTQTNGTESLPDQNQLHEFIRNNPL